METQSIIGQLGSIWTFRGKNGLLLTVLLTKSTSPEVAQAWDIRAVVTNRFITLNLQGGGCSLLGRDTILLGELKCVRLDEDGFGVDDSSEESRGV